MRSIFLLLAGLLALIAGFSGPAALNTAPVDRVAVSPRAMAFFDAELDNAAVREDKDAQPARKCSSCFG